MWMLNFGVAVGTVDKRLAEEIKNLIRRDDFKKFPEDWEPQADKEVDQDLYQKFSSELYGVL
eukprot:3419481-Karenia_brevis.AAC.1